MVNGGLDLLFLFRATDEHTARHITDRHTEAPYAGVSEAGFIKEMCLLKL